MKTVLLNLVLIVLVFFGSSVNQIHALTGKATVPTHADAFSNSHSTDDSHKSFYAVFSPKTTQFIIEDTEEEEQEEERVEETHKKNNGNYFAVQFGISKIHYDHITQPATPLLRLEPRARFGQKRYRYLEVYRL